MACLSISFILAITFVLAQKLLSSWAVTTHIARTGSVSIHFRTSFSMLTRARVTRLSGTRVAWLGMRSAIIASGAIVTKDVAAYTIVAGNPAVPIRSRFPATTVDTLLGLGIYRWDEKKFDAMRAYLCADDINALVAALAHYDKNSGTAE